MASRKVFIVLGAFFLIGGGLFGVISTFLPQE